MARRVDKNADRISLDLQLELESFRVELKDLQHKLAVERCERIKLKSSIKKQLMRKSVGIMRNASINKTVKPI